MVTQPARRPNCADRPAGRQRPSLDAGLQRSCVSDPGAKGADFGLKDFGLKDFGLQESHGYSGLKGALRGPQDVSANLRTPELREPSMQILSPRHVKTEESLRLGVESGWYSTKVSGTFVTGPHATQEDCLSKIAELNPPGARKKF
jgi:hypothetical protein